MEFILLFSSWICWNSLVHSEKSPTQIQFKQTGGRTGSCSLGIDLPASMARCKDGLLKDQSQPVIFPMINRQIPSERS